MSDSTAEDAPRKWLKEGVKKVLVSLADSGFVAGTPHRRYLESLGMASERIHVGYDVVDNAYFSTRADQARTLGKPATAAAALPEKYFLTVARFVHKKNLMRLIDSHVEYSAAQGANSVPLVIVGDGPLRADMQDRICYLGAEESIVMYPFAQQEDLPALFAFSLALILPSTVEQWGLVVNEAMAAGCVVLVSERCGCTEDLVVDGVTGFRFDPLQPHSISKLLAHVHENAELAATMGKAAREHVAMFDLQAHVKGFLAAAEAAGMKFPSAANRDGGND